MDCDWCDRWVHDECTSHPSQFDFKYQLCVDICNVYGTALQILVSSSRNAPKMTRATANLSTNLADIQPFEILIWEKKARKCGGCENSLILRRKQKKMAKPPLVSVDTTRKWFLIGQLGCIKLSIQLYTYIQKIITSKRLIPLLI